MIDTTRTPVQARSEHRRQALIDAVVRILAREGAAGITHRAVAREAGASHGHVRYYFATRDDMLSAALAAFIEKQVAASIALAKAAGPPGQGDGIWHLAAAYMANRVEFGREGEIARYELFLHAARYDTLRPALTQWAETYFSLFETEYMARGLSEPRARAERIVYYVNALLLRHLTTPMENFEKGVLLPVLLDNARP